MSATLRTFAQRAASIVVGAGSIILGLEIATNVTHREDYKFYRGSSVSYDNAVSVGIPGEHMAAATRAAFARALAREAAANKEGFLAVRVHDVQSLFRNRTEVVDIYCIPEKKTRPQVLEAVPADAAAMATFAAALQACEIKTVVCESNTIATDAPA